MTPKEEKFTQLKTKLNIAKNILKECFDTLHPYYPIESEIWGRINTSEKAIDEVIQALKSELKNDKKDWYSGPITEYWEPLPSSEKIEIEKISYLRITSPKNIQGFHCIVKFQTPPSEKVVIQSRSNNVFLSNLWASEYRSKTIHLNVRFDEAEFLIFLN